MKWEQHFCDSNTNIKFLSVSFYISVTHTSVLIGWINKENENVQTQGLDWKWVRKPTMQTVDNISKVWRIIKDDLIYK